MDVSNKFREDSIAIEEKPSKTQYPSLKLDSTSSKVALKKMFSKKAEKCHSLLFFYFWFNFIYHFFYFFFFLSGRFNEIFVPRRGGSPSVLITPIASSPGIKSKKKKIEKKIEKETR